jgi:hypothetical protein
MSLIAVSYFVKKKSGYLILQASGIVFLMTSYLLSKEYFAMIGLGIGLMRTLVFFAYEQKNKNASILWSVLFSALTVAAYFIIDCGILGRAKPIDVIYLVALILYAFIFRIRNLEVMRYTVTIPTVLAVLYNVLCKAALVVIVSYSFELCANIVSILKYHVLTKEIHEEKEYEKN